MLNCPALVVVASLAIGQNPPASAQPLPVGVARVDITPDYPVRLHGYLVRKAESKGVEERIWAKALAIGSDEAGASLLISVDNLGVSDAIVTEVATRLKKQAGLARDRFAVASSHTHSAPCLTGVAPNIFGMRLSDDEQAHIDRYTRELTDRLEQVGLAALRDRRPSTLSWGEGRLTFAANRRTPGGPVDHALPVLVVQDLDRRIRALVVGYACHCTTLDPADNLVSGDWAGYGQQELERDHPGAIAMTLIGCGADANPRERGKPELARKHGRALADEVTRILLTRRLTPLTTAPIGKIKRITLPFDTLPTRSELEAMVKEGGPKGYNASTQLARLDRGQSLQEALDYPVQTWQFGNDLVMVFLAGEVVVDYSLRLKEEFDAKRLWVVAYANDLPCYIPSERILREGGYEGGGAMIYYGKPTRLKPGIEDKIIAAVHDLIPRKFNARRNLDVPARPAEAETPRPLTPDQALHSMRVKPGLRIELVAAEPLVVDPVAIDFGADGKLWVCEMRDYPTGTDGHWKPGGRITYLEDTNGDGKYDRSTPFLEGVPFPTGLMAWRKGVLICAAPDILYAEDTDGDGKADVRRTLFHGFATENYQARVNGLFYGLDNWVYGANGLIGGAIRGTATGKTIEIGGRDFRINPDDGAMEPASGLTQQGRVRDDWGNQFGGNNSILIQHYPLPDHYARRNPFVAVPAPAVFVPRDEDSAQLYPASRTLARYNHPESANRVTSACSPMIYRDFDLGPEYYGNAFICEPVHNLVHREVLTQEGVTFAGHRAADEQKSEFLASTDNWFRPVQVRTGPEGALYVVDMYRFVIEHPRWISPEQLATLDVRAGDDKGRIYRIVRAGQPERPVPVLDTLDSSTLAEQLDSPGGTLRDNVQRLLVHRQDKSAALVLSRLAKGSPNAECRMQALCTLDGLRALEPELVRAALADSHPGVRRQAIRLAEQWFASDPAMGPAVVKLSRDPDPGVRFQLALSLGEWDDERAGQALAQLGMQKGTDRWIQAAVLSSAGKRTADVLAKVLQILSPPPARSFVTAPGYEVDPDAAARLLGPLIATAAGAGRTADLAKVLGALETPSADTVTVAWLARLADLFEVLDRPAARKSALALPSTARLGPSFRVARGIARDPRAKPADRVTAVRLLGRDPAQVDADLDLLIDLTGPQDPVEVQLAAVKAVSRQGSGRAASKLLPRWASLGPSVRNALLDSLLERQEGTAALLEALEAGTIPPKEIDAAHRQQLLKRDNDDLRRRAVASLGGGTTRARQEVVASYRASIQQPGNATRGARTFGRVCSVCHRVKGQGSEVGPDLTALTDTSLEALAIAILDPNRDVDARYAGYTAALADGRVLTGIIASETGNAITLKGQEGRTDVILRTDLEALKSSGQSLMPEGLDRDLSPTDLADVAAYLGSAIAAPKSMPGNEPSLVHQANDGTVKLEARTAAMYGDTLIFEPENANLGYWQSGNDRAVWSFQVDRPATFTVTMEWACADESAGNAFQFRIGNHVLPGVVGGTGAGTWANYRSIFVGEVALPAGSYRGEFAPDGPIQGALLDLRAMVLTPRTDKVYSPGK